MATVIPPDEKSLNEARLDYEIFKRLLNCLSIRSEPSKPIDGVNVVELKIRKPSHNQSQLHQLRGNIATEWEKNDTLVFEDFAKQIQSHPTAEIFVIFDSHYFIECLQTLMHWELKQQRRKRIPSRRHHHPYRRTVESFDGTAYSPIVIEIVDPKFHSQTSYRYFWRNKNFEERDFGLSIEHVGTIGNQTRKIMEPVECPP